MTCKVALIQMNSGGDIAANISALEAYVAEAAGQGAQLVATPENTFMINAPKAERDFHSQEEHPGVQAASRIAKENKVWLLIGSVAIAIDDSGKTVNRSILFDDKGQVVAAYDKIHLFDVNIDQGAQFRESERYLSGDKAVIASTPYARLGLTICYDLRFPHLYRDLAKGGAQILAVPSAFMQFTGAAHWHTLLKARAIENTSYVIAPAQCGEHPGGRKTFGHSLVIDPWGEIIADGGTAPGVVMAELDMDKLAKVRDGLPSLSHDRDFVPATK